MTDNLFLSDEKPLRLGPVPKESIIKGNSKPINPDFVISFHEDPETPIELGRLKMNDHGELTFMGDADASAKAFFDLVVGCNSLAIKRYRRALERISCTSTDEVSREIAKGEL